MAKTTNPDLNWHAQRVLWNKEGKCARKACERRHRNWVHPDTKLCYCSGCKRLIDNPSVGLELYRDRGISNA